MATQASRNWEPQPLVPARSRWATVRVETDAGVYVGRMFVAGDTLRVSDVLADDRQFLSLADVKVNDGEQVEAFMAVNKSYVRTLRILDEGRPGDHRPRPRVAQPS